MKFLFRIIAASNIEKGVKAFMFISFDDSFEITYMVMVENWEDIPYVF